jgi:hypothetical protein
MVLINAEPKARPKFRAYDARNLSVPVVPTSAWERIGLRVAINFTSYLIYWVPGACRNSCLGVFFLFSARIAFQTSQDPKLDLQN